MNEFIGWLAIEALIALLLGSCGASFETEHTATATHEAAPTPISGGSKPTRR